MVGPVGFYWLAVGLWYEHFFDARAGAAYVNAVAWVGDAYALKVVILCSCSAVWCYHVAYSRVIVYNDSGRLRGE